MTMLLQLAVYIGLLFNKLYDAHICSESHCYIRHPYITNILCSEQNLVTYYKANSQSHWLLKGGLVVKYTCVAKIRPKFCKPLHNCCLISCKTFFLDNLLNKTIILLNLAEYRLILATSA